MRTPNMLAAAVAATALLGGCVDILGGDFQAGAADSGVDSSKSTDSGGKDSGGRDSSGGHDTGDTDHRAPPKPDSGGTTGCKPACGTHQTCTLVGGSATCTCDASACGQAGTLCQDDETLDTCAVDADGCFYVTSMATCGTHQTCTSAGSSATCTCDASPCEQAGTVCQDSATVDTCVKDTNGCLYVASTDPCVSPKSCGGLAPTAACALTCSNSCTAGQASCVGGDLATCTLGSDGCYALGTPAPCPSTNQSCTGAAGSAMCTCNGSTCTSTGSMCGTSTEQVICSEDSQGCFYQSGTVTCPYVCSAGVCGGVCVPGTTQCCDMTKGECGATGYSGNGGQTTCEPSGVAIDVTTPDVVQTEVCLSTGEWSVGDVCATCGGGGSGGPGDPAGCPSGTTSYSTSGYGNGCNMCSGVATCNIAGSGDTCMSCP